MSERSTRRFIGLDVHRDFAQVAIWEDGVVRQSGRFATTPEGVRAFAADLGPADEVALEATGNTWAIAALLASRAGRVVVSNPVKTRAIAEAKVKTDKVDAQILASCWPQTSCPRYGCLIARPARCAGRCCAGRTWCGSGPG
jgi:transposase